MMSTPEAPGLHWMEQNTGIGDARNKNYSFIDSGGFLK